MPAWLLPSLALLAVAFLGWDVARREIGRRARADAQQAKTADTAPALEAMRTELVAFGERVTAVEGRIVVHEKAIENGVNEMRALLAPVRSAVLKAVPDGRRREAQNG